MGLVSPFPEWLCYSMVLQSPHQPWCNVFTIFSSLPSVATLLVWDKTHTAPFSSRNHNINRCHLLRFLLHWCWPKRPNENDLTAVIWNYNYQKYYQKNSSCLSILGDKSVSSLLCFLFFPFCGLIVTEVLDWFFFQKNNNGSDNNNNIHKVVDNRDGILLLYHH